MATFVRCMYVLLMSSFFMLKRVLVKRAKPLLRLQSSDPSDRLTDPSIEYRCLEVKLDSKQHLAVVEQWKFKQPRMSSSISPHAMDERPAAAHLYRYTLRGL